MPFRGFSCPTAEICGFFVSDSGDVLVLFFGFHPVDKSVRRPNRRINRQVTGESAFQLGELGKQGIQAANAGGLRDWTAAGLPTRKVEEKK